MLCDFPAYASLASLMLKRLISNMAIKKATFSLVNLRDCCRDAGSLSQDNFVKALAVCLELLLGRIIVFKSAHRPTVRNTLTR